MQNPEPAVSPSTPSLAPFGATLPGSRKRLSMEYTAILSDGRPDPEVILMEMWAAANIYFGLPQGTTPPIQTILGLSSWTLCFTSPTFSSDRQVVAALIQWMGTSCGRSFYHEFQKDLASRRKPVSGKALIFHKWKQENIRTAYNGGRTPIIAILRLEELAERRSVSPPSHRELQLIHAAIGWIGSDEGRAFYEKFQTELERRWEIHQTLRPGFCTA